MLRCISSLVPATLLLFRRHPSTRFTFSSIPNCHRSVRLLSVSAWGKTLPLDSDDQYASELFFESTSDAVWKGLQEVFAKIQASARGSLRHQLAIEESLKRLQITFVRERIGTNARQMLEHVKSIEKLKEELKNASSEDVDEKILIEIDSYVNALKDLTGKLASSTQISRDSYIGGNLSPPLNTEDKCLPSPWYYPDLKAGQLELIGKVTSAGLRPNLSAEVRGVPNGFATPPASRPSSKISGSVKTDPTPSIPSPGPARKSRDRVAEATLKAFRPPHNLPYPKKSETCMPKKAQDNNGRREIFQTPSTPSTPSSDPKLSAAIDEMPKPRKRKHSVVNLLSSLPNLVASVSATETEPPSDLIPRFPRLKGSEFIYTVKGQQTPSTPFLGLCLASAESIPSSECIPAPAEMARFPELLDPTSFISGDIKEQPVLSILLPDCNTFRAKAESPRNPSTTGVLTVPPPPHSRAPQNTSECNAIVNDVRTVSTDFELSVGMSKKTPSTWPRDLFLLPEELINAATEAKAEVSVKRKRKGKGAIQEVTVTENLPELSYIEDLRGYKVLYVKTTQEAEKAAALLKGPIIGLDTEWPHPCARRAEKRNCISLLQLCDAHRMIVLFHVEHMSPFPTKLREILEDDKILKFGSCISGDGSRIKNYPHAQWGISSDAPDTAIAVPSTAVNALTVSDDASGIVDIASNLMSNLPNRQLELASENSLASKLISGAVQNIPVQLISEWKEPLVEPEETNNWTKKLSPRAETAARAFFDNMNMLQGIGENSTVEEMLSPQAEEAIHTFLEVMDLAHEGKCKKGYLQKTRKIVRKFYADIKTFRRKRKLALKMIEGKFESAKKKQAVFQIRELKLEQDEETTTSTENLNTQEETTSKEEQEEGMVTEIQGKKGLIVVRSMVDLGSLAVQVADFTEHGNRPQQKLDNMVNILLGRKLLKPKQTICSDWHRKNLTDKQVMYAANDAYASLKLAEHIQSHQRQFPTITGTVEVEKLRKGSGVLKRPSTAFQLSMPLTSSECVASPYILRIKDSGEDWRIEEGTIDDWIQRNTTWLSYSRLSTTAVDVADMLEHQYPAEMVLEEVL